MAVVKSDVNRGLIRQQERIWNISVYEGGRRLPPMPPYRATLHACYIYGFSFGEIGRRTITFQWPFVPVNRISEDRRLRLPFERRSVY